jgi:predicted ATPase
VHDQATFWGTERCHHEIAVPDPKRLPGVETHSQYEAVRLFLERARAAKADFAVTNENVFAVAEICARLNGVAEQPFLKLQEGQV